MSKLIIEADLDSINALQRLFSKLMDNGKMRTCKIECHPDNSKGDAQTMLENCRILSVKKEASDEK